MDFKCNTTTRKQNDSFITDKISAHLRTEPFQCHCNLNIIQKGTDMLKGNKIRGFDVLPSNRGCGENSQR